MLHKACQNGAFEAVDWLLIQNPDAVNTTNEDGLTPIEIALAQKNLQIALRIFREVRFAPNPDLAEKIFYALEALLPECNTETDQAIATCFYILGLFFEDFLIDSDSAKACFERAIGILKKMYLSDKIIYFMVNVFITMAVMCSKNNNNEDAIAVISDALHHLELLSTQGNEYRNIKIKCYQLLIDYQIHSNLFEEAIYTRNLLIEFLGDLNQDNYHQIAKQQSGIARSYLTLNNKEKASEYFDLALKTFRHDFPKTDDDYLLISKICLKNANVYAGRIGKREEARQCYQSAIEILLMLENYNRKTIAFIREIYRTWNGLYIRSEHGFEFTDAAFMCFHSVSRLDIGRFKALCGFITDRNNWQLAQPFYQPLKHLMQIALKTYSSLDVSPAIREFLSEEANRKDFEALLSSLQPESPLSLEQTVYSGSAPLLALARQQKVVEARIEEHEQKFLSIARDEGFFSTKRTADGQLVREGGKRPRIE